MTARFQGSGKDCVLTGRAGGCCVRRVRYSTGAAVSLIEYPITAREVCVTVFLNAMGEKQGRVMGRPVRWGRIAGCRR